MRGILTSDPASVFAEMLREGGVDVPVYSNDEVPTTKVRPAFVLVEQNGQMSSYASQLGFAECTILVAVYAKIRSASGGTSNKTENRVLQKIEEILGLCAVKDGCTFTPEREGLVYYGRDVLSGYSTKAFNINAKILFNK